LVAAVIHIFAAGLFEPSLFDIIFEIVAAVAVSVGIAL
jgi:hypothetical protein